MSAISTEMRDFTSSSSCMANKAALLVPLVAVLCHKRHPGVTITTEEMSMMVKSEARSWAGSCLPRVVWAKVVGGSASKSREVLTGPKLSLSATIYLKSTALMRRKGRVLYGITRDPLKGDIGQVLKGSSQRKIFSR